MNNFDLFGSLLTIILLLIMVGCLGWAIGALITLNDPSVPMILFGIALFVFAAG